MRTTSRTASSPTMSLPVVCVALVVAGCLFAQPASAQQGSLSTGEFIESTSPLRGGGAVTSTSAPGRGIQTRTTIESIPIGRPNSRSTAGSNPYEGYRTASAGSTSGTARFEADVTPFQNEARERYDYPAQDRTAPVLTVAQQTTARPQNAAPGGASIRQTAFQAPGLNYSQAQVAQNCNCGPNGTQGFQVPANQPPAINVQVPTAIGAQQQQVMQVPATVLPGSNPSYNYQIQPGFQTPQIGSGFSNFSNGVSGQLNQVGNTVGNWINPFLTGSGAYQPIVRLQNMPPGTYLGQGIIGQPTAYVDGQPIRNLLRYISP